MMITLSPRADATSRLLMETLAQHRRQQALLGATLGRTGRIAPPTGHNTPDEIRRQATLVRLMSIVEAFTAEALALRLERQVPAPRTKVLDDVYSSAEDVAIGSWPSMVRYYGQWLGIKITQGACPAWRQVEAMTNARNAVAHGVGELTRRMARKDLRQLGYDLATIDIVIVKGAVRISENSVHECAFVGRSFVEWLDLHLAGYDTLA